MKAEILKALENGGPMMAAEIAKILGVRMRDIQTAIAELSMSGTIVGLGDGRRVKYHLNSHIRCRGDDKQRPGAADVYTGEESAPLRAGALDHLRCGSRRGSTVVPYSPPVGFLGRRGGTSTINETSKT
jgi:hypothetical protein